MKIALVAPHMFMHSEIMHELIFAPGVLVIDLAKELKNQGIDVTLFSPNYKVEGIKNINGDLTYLNEELKLRGYGLTELLQKHPFLFATLARQIQAELISKVYEMANNDEFDLVHIYMNEEELALVMRRFCKKPVVFTHHEPFNYLTKYRSIFPKYKYLDWVSISLSQRDSAENGTNFIGNIYHGIPENKFELNLNPKGDYFAYIGRIIEPKGVHLAIKAAKKAGVKLKIAGKHYTDSGKDSYWEQKVLPEIDNDLIEYIGFVNDAGKQEFLGNAKAILMPSIWNEPFGVVAIEAMACGTPIIALDSGALNEIIENNKNGTLVKKVFKNKVLDEEKPVNNLVEAISQIKKINRQIVRKVFEEKFTLKKMAAEHIKLYSQMIT